MAKMKPKFRHTKAVTSGLLNNDISLVWIGKRQNDPENVCSHVELETWFPWQGMSN